VLDFVRDLSSRMMHCDFLWEAGAEQPTYFVDDPVRFGAIVQHRNSPYGETFVRISISERENGRVVYLRDYPKGKHDIKSASAERIDVQPGGSYFLTASLIQDERRLGEERVLDRIVQPLNIWEPDRSLDWVTVEDGELRVGGEIWKPYGVNYMPSSGIALHDWEAFEYWLEPRGYDPAIIDRDLSRISELGMNMVSAFVYHRSLEHGNLIDFLYRCEKHGLRVNLSLRPGTPLDFPWENVKEIIEDSRLAEMPNVFAFDLAWEPNFRNREKRRAHLEPWNEWVREKHGSLEAAIEFWNFTPDRLGESLDVPSDEQWYSSGEWDAMLADYFKFVEEYLGEKYREARRLVKSIAPNQLVSFRMQHTGDPTHRGPKMIPYPARAFADAVDIFEPEAYGRIGDWNRVRPGYFTAAYLRALNPNLPVFWAEIGLSCWNVSEGRATERGKERVAEYYEDFHKMLLGSHANGVALWWFPGGYRVNEKSDYGILNPDGTDRPVTRVIRVRTDREENLRRHNEVAEAVARSVRGTLG